MCIFIRKRFFLNNISSNYFYVNVQVHLHNAQNTGTAQILISVKYQEMNSQVAATLGQIAIV